MGLLKKRNTNSRCIDRIELGPLEQLDTLRTIFRLGVRNVATVLIYRSQLRFGLLKRKFKSSEISFSDRFFQPVDFNQRTDDFDLSTIGLSQLVNEADGILEGSFTYYSHHQKNLSFPPNWFLNPFNQKTIAKKDVHWTEINAFDEVGDIKNTWELSRFDWVYTLGRAYVYTQHAKYLEGLNILLFDWHQKNPINKGPNWFCGQETSIRVFAIMNVAFFLDQIRSPTQAFLESMEAHMQRVYLNINYALAQDNNHATSEATALYIIGNWLTKYASSRSTKDEANRIAKKAKRLLERTVDKLFDTDGTFSQYSVNYHRVALDTICFAELWRERFELQLFSEQFYIKAKQATRWMLLFTDNLTGVGVNIGSNDGALLLRSHSCNYRDFRPSCQLASSLFLNKIYFSSDGLWNEPLFFFKVKRVPKKVSQPIIKEGVLDSNYILFQSRNSWACLRLPRFKFRPKQMDVFHFDLSYKGHNVLCDAGSFSYNPKGIEISRAFNGTQAHNTVYFGNEQMPKVSRFLAGHWLKLDSLSQQAELANGGKIQRASFKDYLGNKHFRSVSWNNDVWTINDEVVYSVKALQRRARVSFNINSSAIELAEYGNVILLRDSNLKITFSSKVEVSKVEVSDYYMERHEIYCALGDVSEDGMFETRIEPC